MISKKILLLIFLAFLIVIPAGKVGATQYYVGVTIASASAPGYPSGTTNNNWCLPNYTTIAIRNDGANLTAVSPTSNPTTITGVACADDTIWSGLFNLTSGTEYQIYIVPANASTYNYNNSYCSGFWDGSYSYCWVSDTTSESCASVCSHYGSTIRKYTSGSYDYTYNYQNSSSSYPSYNCAIESFLMGGTCSSCTAGSTYNYYNPSSASHACYYSQTYYNANDKNGTAVLGEGLVRVCPCYIQSNSSNVNFTFTFTPSF